MSLEAVQNLSIPDLLRALNERLGLECTRLQKYYPPVVHTASLRTEVSKPVSSVSVSDGGSLRAAWHPVDRKSRN